MLEIAIYYIYIYYKYELPFRDKMLTESFNEEKVKKKLDDAFEINKYLATGKNAFERIYNNKQNDIPDLVHKLALEAFPNSWDLEVKVEEFTNVLLLIQIDKTIKEPLAKDIVNYLNPMLKYCGRYLQDVAVFNKKHQCYLFFDSNVLEKIIREQELNNNDINDIKKKGYELTLFNSIKIEYQEQFGHILIPVLIAGDSENIECTMMLDTGASMTVISSELSQKTGLDDLRIASRKTFSTAKGQMSCPIVEREIIINGIVKKQKVAVNTEDDTNLLGVDFFESKEYIIDNTSKCIYIWKK